jgi:hypothetical protein
MSKFLTSSANYSETNILLKYLSPILESYNKEVIFESKKLSNKQYEFIIPNNNNKYYLFIINKTDITPNDINSKYKILYFFPDTQNTIDNNIFKKSYSDFYVEIDNYKTSFTNSNYLFEGYYYETHKHFLITDVLAIDFNIIKCDYSLRYSLIYNLISNQNLTNLNGHLTINIHSIFELDSKNNDINVQGGQLFNIFKNNFIFKDDICAIEYINMVSYKKYRELLKVENKEDNKTIIKTKYIDVYQVFNYKSNNLEGILYVKGLKESKLLKDMFLKNDSVELKCKFNNIFKKWQPCF